MTCKASSLYLVPFTWIGGDDVGFPRAVLVTGATSKAQAVQQVRDAIRYHAEEAYWGYAADWGGTPEQCDADSWYLLNAADCEECSREIDADDHPHDDETVMVMLHAENAEAFATRQEALDAAWLSARTSEPIELCLHEETGG